jgi:hypothetical protein
MRKRRNGGKIGRPCSFDIDVAWDIYIALPPEQRTYANVAREISDRYHLDPPITGTAISSRFATAGLIKKGKPGAPKLKAKVKSNAERSRQWRQRKKGAEQELNA